MKYWAVIIICLLAFPAFSRDKAIEASYIYNELLNASNYEIVNYNYPAGSRELDLFRLNERRQYNINAVAAPDFNNLVYSEVYFYPDPRVTASALYIVPLNPDISKKEAILSVSTKNKITRPIIETDYAKLYPLKFNTFTPVDWNKKSDKILFKEKLGIHYDQIYLTKLYLYDMSSETLYDLNIVRSQIVNDWAQKGVYLADYKWDIVPLGFINGTDKIAVNAFGYYKKERKFLGVWAVDSYGQNASLLSMDSKYNADIEANGKCLKFIPDIADIFKKQRRIDEKTKHRYIEPK